MICNECKGCKKFLTNDCSGVKEFTEKNCQEMIAGRKNEIDVGGCC